MKQLALIISLVILVIFSVGCSSSPSDAVGSETGSNTVKNDERTNTVLICDFSDSVSEATHQREYEFADHEKYDDRNVKSNVELSVGGTTYAGSYQYQQYRGCNYYPAYTYAASNGDLFSIDDNGMLVSYFRGSSDGVDGNLTEEQCLQIAKDFLNCLVDISQYEIDTEDSGESGKYKFKFTKVIGDIETTDTATVTILSDGSLYSYSSFMFGKIDKNTVISVDVQSAVASINRKLDQVYAEAKKYYSRVEYDTTYAGLTVLKDGTAGLLCYTDVHFINTVNEYTMVKSEKVQSVVVDSSIVAHD